MAKPPSSAEAMLQIVDFPNYKSAIVDYLTIRKVSFYSTIAKVFLYIVYNSVSQPGFAIQQRKKHGNEQYDVNLDIENICPFSFDSAQDDRSNEQNNFIGLQEGPWKPEALNSILPGFGNLEGIIQRLNFITKTWQVQKYLPGCNWILECTQLPLVPKLLSGCIPWPV